MQWFPRHQTLGIGFAAKNTKSHKEPLFRDVRIVGLSFAMTTNGRFALRLRVAAKRPVVGNAANNRSHISILRALGVLRGNSFCRKEVKVSGGVGSFLGWERLPLLAGGGHGQLEHRFAAGLEELDVQLVLAGGQFGRACKFQ